MSGISASLDAHHDHLEALLGEAVIAARSGNWAVYRARFSALRVALLQHIAYEDEELFPELGRALDANAGLEALRGEHASLRRHFETLGAAAPEHDPEGCLAELEQLALLIREHHANELRVCYPQLQSAAAKS